MALEKNTMQGHEQLTINNELKAAKGVSIWKLLQYADAFDLILMLWGTVGAVVDGFSLPILIVILRSPIHAFGSFANGTPKDSTLSRADFTHTINKCVVQMLYIGLAVGACCFLEGFCWTIAADRQTSRLRRDYLRAILRKDVGYLDTKATTNAEVVNTISADAATIHDTIGQKVPHFIMHMSHFVGGFVIGFSFVWKLGVLLVASIPLLLIPLVVFGKRQALLAKDMRVAYLKASEVAEEAISSIRTVFSFVGEKRTITGYAEALNETLKVGLRQGLVKGLTVGSVGLSLIIWAVLSWYGSRLVMHNGVPGANVISVGLATINAIVSLCLALPDFKPFAESWIAAGRIFEIIDHVPDIDSEESRGIVLEKVQGKLEIRNVNFAYPARPSTIIFKRFSLTIPAGQTVALVGESGSGKSTIFALIERFYDPLSGGIFFDDVNIKDMQLKWLRSQMSLVTQETALFSTTIKENILIGKENATMGEIIQAAKAANVHDFVEQMPDGYNTQVGERGVQVSGGQKQRIAIARAILKNTKVLLLDEPTSALDAESANIVQEALINVSLGHTIVVVSHQLSSIKSANLIAIIQNGRVVEVGEHDELLHKHENGVYAKMVGLKQRTSREESNNEFKNSSTNLCSPNVDKLRSPYVLNNLDQTVKLTAETKVPTFGRLLALNRPEWIHGLLGTVGAIGFGIVYPTYSFLIGNTISVLYYTDFHQLKSRATINSLSFAVLAGFNMLASYLQHYNFTAMGEHLIRRVREKMLSKILTFEVGWFDQDENSGAKISSQLATEASMVRSLVSDRISLALQTASSILVSSTLGLIASWRLSIPMMALQPFLIFCYYFKNFLLKNCTEVARQARESASQMANEAVNHHKTILAFSSQDMIMNLFKCQQKAPQRDLVKSSSMSGLGLGIAQTMIFSNYAFGLWYGSRLLSKGKISTGQMFETFMVILVTGRIVGEAFSMTFDLSKGASAVETLFKIMDRESQISIDDAAGQRLENIQGSVEIKNVSFCYPSRPHFTILSNFSLKVDPRSTIALVGQSGSGKSTLISLIMRFYDPLLGSVRVDGFDIRILDVKTLRKQIGLVSQEPTLFSGTIQDNILYGKENATEIEVIEAAKASHAHEFICSLSNGYNTLVGIGGLQLSGGQKQRIAMARAIIKNPVILLLDEATSALDVYSEYLVQNALENIMIGRTMLIVAHRLTTIKNADTIAVVQDGAIVEQGKHSELMEKGNGPYYSLFELQRPKI
ncbi:hypothetical protein O6H91_07G013600 [Diphasiastrum complanatum]|uniref:Uncharacterized protein n=2 Tax=Diphasiastrum complanatum TaxID=34168 RepID=A0ACC2D2K4_DIPCM|nr:hypothetical protein O6H91_07G013600 [Diphasiastrum complanatum]